MLFRLLKFKSILFYQFIEPAEHRETMIQQIVMSSIRSMKGTV